jgi:hypothetical protein
MPKAPWEDRIPEALRSLAATNADRLRELYDVWAMPVGCSLHFKSGGWMDLVIERLQRDRVSLTHYGEQNGDLMKDQDMEVLLAHDGGLALAVSYQNDYVGVYQTTEDNPHSQLEHELNDFLRLWLKNIHEQGFSKPTPAEVQRRQEELAEFLAESRG